MNKKLFWHHFLIGILATGLVYLFWWSRPNWIEDMRIWRAIGDTSLILLVMTLSLGPLARLWSRIGSWISWRRELGIWFALLGLTHTFQILDGWVRWDFMQFFGYQFIPDLGRYARVEPGFGLANLIGLVAAFGALILLATSSNRAINFLGGRAWKWLQSGAYVIFYLVALHAFYFLFIHYSPSPNSSVLLDPNWFRYPTLVLILIVPSLQVLAFAKTVRLERLHRGK